MRSGVYTKHLLANLFVLLSFSGYGAVQAGQPEMEVATPIGKVIIVTDLDSAFPSFKEDPNYQRMTKVQRKEFYRDILQQLSVGADTWPTRKLAEEKGLFSIPAVIIGSLEFFVTQISRNRTVIRNELPQPIVLGRPLKVRVFDSEETLRRSSQHWENVSGKNGYFDPAKFEIGLSIDKNFLDMYYPAKGHLVQLKERAAIALGSLRRTVLPTLYHEFLHAAQRASDAFIYDSPFLAEGQAVYMSRKLEREELLYPLVARQFLGNLEMAQIGAASVTYGRFLSPTEYRMLDRIRDIFKGGNGQTIARLLLMKPEDFGDPKVSQKNYDLAWLFYFFLENNDNAETIFQEVSKIAVNLSAEKNLELLAKLENHLIEFLEIQVKPKLVPLEYSEKLLKAVHENDLAMFSDQPFTAYIHYDELLRSDPKNHILMSYLGDLFLVENSRDMFVSLYFEAMKKQGLRGVVHLGGKVRIVERFVNSLWELGLYQKAADLVSDYTFTELEEVSLSLINLRGNFLRRYVTAKGDAKSVRRLECEFEIGRTFASIYDVEKNPNFKQAKSVIDEQGSAKSKEFIEKFMTEGLEQQKKELQKRMISCGINSIPDNAWFLEHWRVTKHRIDPTALGIPISEQERSSENEFSAWDWFYEAQREEEPTAKIEGFSRALKQDPNHFPSIINRCLLNRTIGEFKDALADCNRAVKIGPKEPVAYNNRGWVYEGMGELEKALNDYSHALELDSDYITALENRVNIKLKLNQPQKAIFDLETLIKLQPENAARHNELAWVLIDSELDVNRGIELAKKAVSLSPNEGNFLDTLGWGYYKTKNFSLAIKYLKKAQKYFPDDKVIATHLQKAKRSIAK